MDHKYSIILPVRNGGKYVRECVNSILNQKLSLFELVVLDNNSSDGTLEWIRSLEDKRINLYSSERSLSMEENWGRIRSVPKNEFMTIIGHDDILDTNYLTSIHQLIQNYPDSGLFQTHFRFIDKEGEMIKKCLPMKSHLTGSEFTGLLLQGKIDTMGTGYMMRSAHYEKAGGIPPYPNLLFADHSLWMKLSGNGGLAISEAECFSFRVHQSTSRTTNIASYINAFYLFMDFLVEQKKINTGLKDTLEKYAPDFIAFYCRSFSHRLIKTASAKREQMKVSSFLDKCKFYADTISPGNYFDPRKKADVRMSEIIDNNNFLAKFYLKLRNINN